jgi:hypothetical protein
VLSCNDPSVKIVTKSPKVVGALLKFSGRTSCDAILFAGGGEPDAVPGELGAAPAQQASLCGGRYCGPFSGCAGTLRQALVHQQNHAQSTYSAGTRHPVSVL